LFSQQEKEILERNTKAFEEWLFDKAKYIGLFTKALTPLYQQEMQDEGDLAVEFIGDDITFTIDKRVNDFIQERVSRFADETNTETLKRLTTTIQEGVAGGESLAKMRKRVSEVFVDA